MNNYIRRRVQLYFKLYGASALTYEVVTHSGLVQILAICAILVFTLKFAWKSQFSNDLIWGRLQNENRIAFLFRRA